MIALLLPAATALCAGPSLRVCTPALRPTWSIMAAEEVAAPGEPAADFPVKDYAGEASGLFNNMRAPATLLTGAVLGATFSLSPMPGDRAMLKLVKRLHMLVGLLSVGSELVAIIACTVAINKLSEIKRGATAGVQRLLTSDPVLELWWLTANVNFFAGLIGLCGMTGVRGFLAFGGCGPYWGGAGGCIAASAALLMASLINTAIASGDGSAARGAGVANVFDLFVRYNTLLLKRAASAPLTAASLLCAVGALLFSVAGVRSTLGL